MAPHIPPVLIRFLLWLGSTLLAVSVPQTGLAAQVLPLALTTTPFQEPAGMSEVSAPP